MVSTARNSQELHNKHGWGRGYVDWYDGDTYCISVVFSWLLEECLGMAADAAARGYKVRIGGPAADYAGYSTGASCGDVATRHNPNAMRTSTGCIFTCDFCIVHRVEGYLKEKQAWEPKSIVYDNCLNACSRRHFDRVIDSLKPVPDVDFNQGISAVLLDSYQASRFAELDLRFVRLAWDTVGYESKFMRGFELLRKAGISKSRIGVYVLIGFNDTPDDALYRLESVRKLGIKPFPMRYQPIDTAKRNSYVGEHWTHNELVRFCQYWINLRFVGNLKFKDFIYPIPNELRRRRRVKVGGD